MEGKKRGGGWGKEDLMDEDRMGGVWRSLERGMGECDEGMKERIGC